MQVNTKKVSDKHATRFTKPSVVTQVKAFMVAQEDEWIELQDVRAASPDLTDKGYGVIHQALLDSGYYLVER